jgi:hypothetical protein
LFGLEIGVVEGDSTLSVASSSVLRTEVSSDERV